MVEFHNEYLYPRAKSSNPMGLPGKLSKGYLFALRVQPVSTGPSSSDGSGTGTGDRNAQGGGTDTSSSSSGSGGGGTSTTTTSIEYNIGNWNGFPTNLRMQTLETADDYEAVSGNFYDDAQGYIGGSVFYFPVNDEGDWTGFDGTHPPADEDDRAAWYGSQLASIPAWKIFSDGSGEQFIKHGVRLADGTETRAIENYVWHSSASNPFPNIHRAHVTRTSPNEPGAIDPTEAERAESDADAAPTPSRRTPNRSLSSTVDYNRYKVFQFNPVSWEFSYEMQGTAPTSSTVDGGNAVNTSAPGFVSTRVALTFDRTMEVYAATMGNNTRVDPVFAKVGVQQDVFEVFKIMMDPADFAAALGSDPTALQDVPSSLQAAYMENMSELNSMMFDIGMGGASVAFSPIAVVFNDYFTVQGNVTGVNVTYAAFNNRLVPTIANVTLDISVMNIAARTQSTMLNPTGGQLTPTVAPSLSTSVPSSSGGTSGRARTVTRSSLMPRVQTVPGTNVRFSAQ
jgi:hypothetical protein